jgi:hypothetical protein
VQTTVYVLNRAPTKGLEGTTPFEIWYGKKPSVLEDRDHKIIFVGYEKGTKAYRVYDPVT